MSAEPLAVCMFDSETVRGGAEEHMLCLLRGLDRRRFRLLLACPGELRERLGKDLPDDVEVLPLELSSHRQIGKLGELYRFLRARRVQVLHSHGFRPSLLASPVGRAARVPVTIETPHVREYWRKGWKASYFIDRRASMFVDQYIAVSAANRTYLVEEKKLDSRKITVIRNGCDISRFDADKFELRDVRGEAGIAKDAPLLMAAARLEAQKGHAVLFLAMARLRKEFPALRLVALGDGSLRESLEKLRHELGLDDEILMPGHCPDVRSWMAAADVCVLPSFAEGLPLFAIECLAMQRALVATAVDGTPEIVSDGRTGLTVAAGDDKALAAAIARLLHNPELALRLAEQGRAWVHECFTLERQIGETAELYETLWSAKTGLPIADRACAREAGC